MRAYIAAIGLIALGSNALAADYETPILRGSSPYIAAAPNYFRGWQGFYVGGQGGYSTANVNFASGASSLVSYIVRNSIFSNILPNWTTLPKGDTSNVSYGGFFGYNQQWDEAIVGFEVSYNHTSLRKAATDSIARSFSDDSQAPAGHHFFYNAAVSASASVRVTDLMTFRGRAAWVVDTFLPYAFVGLAIARADVLRSATVESVRTDIPDVTTPVTPPMATVVTGPDTLTAGKRGGIYFGYTAGVGVDFLVTESLFMRTEWELVALPNVGNFKINVNSFRGGLGMKF
jgi:outer membrane immunogenic protein